ncbi:hypothetical protein KSI86_20585 [Dickeya oryzae]|nr:hypothetical protein [Dickeya oryzae]
MDDLGFNTSQPMIVTVSDKEISN